MFFKIVFIVEGLTRSKPFHANKIGIYSKAEKMAYLYQEVQIVYCILF